jgi:hypothetical protein
MYHPEFFIPFYCNHCNQLAFLCKNKENSETNVLEYQKANWQYHLCYKIKGNAIWNHNPNLPAIEWGSSLIPVNYPKRAKKNRQTDYSIGVIVELPDPAETDVKNSFYKVLTTENSVVYIRSVQSQTVPSAGLLIDLSKAKKVGNDKFRIPEILPINVVVDLEKQEKEINEYFKFTLSANDQEQLESFVDRFLKTLSKNNLYLQNIIPLENKAESDQIVYQRRLTVISAYKLQKTIETITFPESIRISIQ